MELQLPPVGGVRSGTVAVHARTQSPIDGRDRMLINASPDIAQQIRSNPALQPPSAPGNLLRHNPSHGVVLMDSQIDHVTGR